MPFTEKALLAQIDGGEDGTVHQKIHPKRIRWQMEDFEMMDSLVEKLQPIIQAQQMLARRAEIEYAAQVNAIIQEQCKDPQHIERVLTWMLDFCFDDNMLSLFKKLCRYYYRIDPEATASYVYIYRDMWDSDKIPEDEPSDEVRS